MDLLYPALEFYIQSEISRVAFAALTAVSGLIAAIIIIFQMRSATLRLIDPWLMLAIYAAFVCALLFLLGRYMAKKLKSKNPAKTISKYLFIGLITAFVCYILGAFLQYLALVS